MIYVAQKRAEPTYGWPAIQQYLAALLEHLEKVLSKELRDVQSDLPEDRATAFFRSRSRVKLKGREELHEPSSRVSMLFRRTAPGRRVIHFHESALSARAAGVAR